MNGAMKTGWRERTALACLVLTTIASGAGIACAQQTDGTQSTSATRSAPPQIAGGAVAIAREVTPAVVSINVEIGASRNAAAPGGSPFPPGFPSPFPQQQPAPTEASGSGFIVTPDGYILTNNHVVAHAEKVTVTLLDHRVFDAKVIGHDPNTDVALIQIPATGLPTIPLGDDSTVQVGEPVVAVGNPLGLDFTVTAGIVSAKNRAGNLVGLYQSNYAIVDFIQTDAVINPGNSGGPLVDMTGHVIGINSAIVSPTGVYAGYGFAIPISLARVVMNDFLKYGRIRRPIVGLSLEPVGPTDAAAAGLKDIRGALVGGFSGPDSPAKAAGILPGDVIVAVDGTPIDRVAQIQRMIFGMTPGQTVTITVMRYGKRMDFRVKLGEAPASAQLAQGAQPNAGPAAPIRGKLGIAVEPVPQATASQLGLETPGLGVVDVDPTGPAAGKLAPREDIIVATIGPNGQTPVRTSQDLANAESSARNGVVSLLVYNTQAKATRVVNLRVRDTGNP